MDRSQKEGFVSEIVDRINRAPTVYLTDFSGLNVTSMTELRRSLRAAGAVYVVVKNRLAKRAFAETDLPDITESLEGPTGMVFSYEDAVGAAKALSDFAKANDEKPSFKLGIMDNKVLQPEQVEAIAKLPSREVLLSELVGALEAPMSMLATAMEGKLQEMAGLIDALKAEREQAG